MLKDYLKRFWLLVAISLAFLIFLAVIFSWESSNGSNLNDATKFSGTISRMSSLNDTISGNLYRVGNEAKNGTDSYKYSEIIDSINKDARVLQSYFAAMERGGKAEDTDVPAAYTKGQPEVAETLANSKRIFEEASKDIFTFIDAAKRQDPSETLFQKINFNVQPKLENIRTQLKSISDTNTKTVKELTKSNQGIKYFTLFIGILFMAIYALHHLWKYLRAEAIAKYRKAKNNFVMEKSTDCFMVVDPDGVVSEASIKGLEDNLDDTKIIDYSFDDIMLKLINSKDVEKFREFTQHFFNETIKDEQFAKMSPIKELTLTDESESDDLVIPKHMRLDFFRIRNDDGKIVQVLTRLTDISAEHKVEELKDTQSKSDSLLSEILNVIFENRSQQFGHFLEITNDSIANINNRLKSNSEGGVDNTDLRSTLNDISQEVSSLSQNIQDIKLTSFDDLLVEFSSEINHLKRDPNLTGNDFLPIVMKLDELITMQQYITNVVKKFEDLNVIKKIV